MKGEKKPKIKILKLVFVLKTLTLKFNESDVLK